MNQPPLTGVRVVEHAEGVAGPMTGRLLADAGADVIKVEPSNGDRSRGWVPRHAEVGVVFTALNRNKRSTVIDPRSTQWSTLVGLGDVLVIDQEIVDESSIDIDALVETHPGLVVCVISGWGRDGPWAQRPGR